MDKALASTAKPGALMLACDGFLMIREDRLQVARARFSECLEIANPKENADDDYVVKFCRLWLAFYDESVGFEALKSAAVEQNSAWSKASRMVQIYLPRSPVDALEKVCGHRTATSQDGWRQYSQGSLINTKIDPQPVSISTKSTFGL